MTTARQLRLERLSAAAASAGERGSSVLELITLFNAFFEARVGDQAPPNGIVFRRATLAASDESHNQVTATVPKADPAEEVSTADAVVVELQPEDGQLDSVSAAADIHSVSWFGTLTALIATALVSLWRSVPRVRERIEAFLCRTVASIVVGCGRRRREDDDPAGTLYTHEDTAMATVLRLAIELEEAHARTHASRLEWYDHERQLAAVHARLAALCVDADASASARRFHEQLCAIVRASSGEDSATEARELQCPSVWV